MEGGALEKEEDEREKLREPRGQQYTSIQNTGGRGEAALRWGWMGRVSTERYLTAMALTCPARRLLQGSGSGGGDDDAGRWGRRQALSRAVRRKGWRHRHAHGTAGQARLRP